MLRSEAWEFVLMYKQYLNCQLVTNCQNFYSNSCFVPVEYSKFLTPEVMDQIVILLPFHSSEEIFYLFGGYLYQKNKKLALAHTTNDVNIYEDNQNKVCRSITDDLEDLEDELEQESTRISKVLSKKPNRDLKSSAEQEDLQCHLCGKTFSKSRSLRQHKYQVHNEEAKHKCSYCPSVFRTTSILHNHLKTHREPAFQCFKCSRKFTFKHHLIRHSKTCRNK